MNNKIIKDSFQAYLTENAKLTKFEEYPIIEKEMVSKEIPKDIITFKESLTIPKEYRKNFYICTYAPDESFERIRRNPKKYVDYFIQFGGIIGFDYSVHSDLSFIKQKSQINDNLSLTYYYAKHGVNIIPNFRYGNDSTLEEFCAALPNNELIAIGTHGFIKSKAQKLEWLYCINELIEKLNPSGIIVYGTLSGKIFDKLKEAVPIYQYDSWAEKKNKGKYNGN